MIEDVVELLVDLLGLFDGEVEGYCSNLRVRNRSLWQREKCVSEHLLLLLL